ncbi:hypothetical protein SCUCBS95973_001618 [Sporothrix curviconia]|uniref:Acyl-coenzyme A oxidase n=1 Tax=Sporothrix curviconia TaxID=1260050 RepID=A0ABP0B081_9PEZI
MPSNPDWVKALRPAGPQGSELLSAERAKSDVNVDGLAEHLFTAEALARKARILDLLKKDPVFDKAQDCFRGRESRIVAALARGKRLRQLAVQHGWTTDEEYAANDLVGEPNPYGLHASMFLVTLREQSTPEQRRLFYERAARYEIIGCYAQTELGHGSNVRGLETTATWNPEDQTFTLHSPTLTAAKWWIGSLGKAANHAVVMAQLCVGGRRLGPHPFVVQIRDMQTHEPLPNVHVGDIGPKFGYNTMDNGFLLFRHLKVPHVSMLARFAYVDPATNKYVRPASASLLYGTMTWVRSNIVLQAGGVLARGVAIAVRYCAVRRQFQDQDRPAADDAGETQVLDYTMVQQRLLPLLAATFALHFAGRAMIEQYQANQAEQAKQAEQAADRLADLHATSCALKAYGSTLAGEGLEVCRRACGGHGYSAFAGIGAWYADYLPTLTWEGDNYMLTQQVARYLLKQARAVQLAGGDAAPSPADNDTTRILKDFWRRRDMGAAFDVLGSEQDVVAAFAWRVAFLTFEALRHRDEDRQTWNALLVDFWRLSTAHAQYMVVKHFYEAVHAPRTAQALDAPTVAALRTLFRLHALHTLETGAAEFFTSGACTVRQIQLARTRTVMDLLAAVRPHAVRLVDAWHFDDWTLASSLGRYDGDVYTDLFHRASELNPLNDVVFDPRPDSSVLLKRDDRRPIASKL